MRSIRVEPNGDILHSTPLFRDRLLKLSTMKNSDVEAEIDRRPVLEHIIRKELLK